MRFNRQIVRVIKMNHFQFFFRLVSPCLICKFLWPLFFLKFPGLLRSTGQFNKEFYVDSWQSWVFFFWENLRKTRKAEVTLKRGSNPSPTPCVGSGDSGEAREDSAQVKPKIVVALERSLGQHYRDTDLIPTSHSSCLAPSPKTQNWIQESLL